MRVRHHTIDTLGLKVDNMLRANADNIPGRKTQHMLGKADNKSNPNADNMLDPKGL